MSARMAVAERLLAHCEPEPNSGCWVWTGSVGRGRPRIFYGGRNAKAHRVSYEVFVGPIPDGLDVDHLCFLTACVNPAHLRPLERRLNVRRKGGDGLLREDDARARGRATLARRSANRIHCRRGHAFTPENTRYVAGRWRDCRACQRERSGRISDGETS